MGKRAINTGHGLFIRRKRLGVSEKVLTVDEPMWWCCRGLIYSVSQINTHREGDTNYLRHGSGGDKRRGRLLGLDERSATKSDSVFGV